MKYNFVLFLSIILILLSFSAVNAAESSNMTYDGVLSLDVSQDNSTELLSEDEKISTLIQNNTISDFNNSEYAINGTDLSANFINLDMNNMNYDGLKVSISNVQYGNLKSNNGVSTNAETINLIKTNTYTPIYNNNLNSNLIIKDKYDLRNDGYVSSIKNQFGNSCWAHAALSALESCILKVTDVEYDFSEVKLSNLADEYLGTGGNRNGRGNIYMSMGYINSWLGTVKENSNSNDPIINVQNIYIIPSDNFEKGVKEAILKYGGVVASYYSADKYYNGNNYYNYGVGDETNHEITIIGWDDNYNKNNFKNSPKGNGAWICKNSYGSYWGDNGYFYISYYDKTLGKISPSYTFILNDSTKYNKNYQYDVQKTDSGNLDSQGFRYFKNTFTSTSDEQLVAISSYFSKDIKYEISIKVGNYEVLSRQVFKSNIGGYFTVKLSKNISIKKGQQFEVIIHNCENSHFEICAQSVLTKKLPAGVSYVSKNGETWYTADNFVCCIKAFTTTSAKLTERYSLTSDGLIKYYGNSKPLTATFKTNDGASAKNVKITIKINGNTYTRTTDDKGVVSININLNSGGYEIPIYLNNNFKQINVKVTVKSTIQGTDVVKIYKNATQYQPTFFDSNGNYLKSGIKVKFNINGNFYERTVGNNGVATLNINLIANEYTITTYNLNTGEQISNKISVLTSIKGADVVKYFKNGTQYRATFLNSDGSLLKNRDVTFNINGVLYTRKTNNEGVATLNINLSPGNYILTATNPVNGEQHSNQITVLSKLKAKDIQMRFKDGTKFEVTVLDDRGRPIGANTQVVFNINGVFYTRSTDSAGVAKLNINLAPNDYVITTTYNGESISNKIHIIP